jgi:hypothetical protein
MNTIKDSTASACSTSPASGGSDQRLWAKRQALPVSASPSVSAKNDAGSSLVLMMCRFRWVIDATILGRYARRHELIEWIESCQCSTEFRPVPATSSLDRCSSLRLAQRC